MQHTQCKFFSFYEGVACRRFGSCNEDGRITFVTKPSATYVIVSRFEEGAQHRRLSLSTVLELPEEKFENVSSTSSDDLRLLANASTDSEAVQRQWGRNSSNALDGTLRHR